MKLLSDSHPFISLNSAVLSVQYGQYSVFIFKTHLKWNGNEVDKR